MEGIIAIIIIVSLISRLANGAKKVKQNAPGQSSAPARPIAQSERPADRPTMQPIQPTVKPTVQPGGFWGQMLEALEDFEDDGILNESKRKKTPQTPKTAPQMNKARAASGRQLAEGSSRECEHGSLGGSMAYTHSDDAAAMQRRVTVQTQPQGAPMYRPAMNAEEMRKAVVMAEILQRPQERMAQQARRWTLR